MTDFLLVTVLTAATSIMMLVALCATATRTDAVPAGVVDPFQPATGSDPSIDTLPTGCPRSKLDPPTATDWQVATLTNLSQVEDLLDCLEANGFAQREVLTLGNSSFAVRWR
jgi:hypothetical protein